MNIFAITSLSVSICCLVLGIFIFVIAKTKIHRIWAIFNLSCFTWAIGTFFVAISDSPRNAEFWWRCAYGLGAFVPYMFYRFNHAFCELEKARALKIIFITSLVFIPANLFFPSFINELAYVFDSFYYNKATLHYNIFMIYLTAVVGLSFKELLNYYKKSQGNKRVQALYLLWGFGIGWSGGYATFLPAYNILIYPSWNFVVCVYTLLMTYAIFKYQLIDIKIAVTRVGVFVSVYILVLGIPIGLGLRLLGIGLWLIPLFLMCVFATVGPFLYLFLQKRAEDKLLKDQRRYQAVLRRASLNMSQIKDLKRLVNLIVYIVARAVHLTHCSFYLFDSSSKNYYLAAVKGGKKKAALERIIGKDSPVIRYLEQHRGPLVYDEIQQMAQDYKDAQLAVMESWLSGLEAALVIPSFAENRLLGLLILGRKQSRKSFSESDLSVFAILANQAALAIENLRSVEEMKRTQEKLFHAEKLAYVGQLASAVVHEVRNPLTAIKTFVSYLPERFRKKDLEFLDRFEMIIPKEIGRMERLVEQLLDLAKPERMKKKELRVSDVVKETLDLLKDNVSLRGIKVESACLTEDDWVMGDKDKIQQVVLNLVLNALDAMEQGGSLRVKVWRENRGGS